MLDKYAIPLFKKPLYKAAKLLNDRGWSADRVSVIGFIAGLLCVFSLSFGSSLLGFIFLAINRICDGVDGEIARINSPTDAGGFLDITLDFIFYALFPLGFAISNPSLNALPAAVLIASFVGTGASFLAFSAMAKKHKIDHPNFDYKGMYYLNGLAEGSETIIVFALMCLMPNHFPVLAWIFAAICVATAINRVWFGYLTLRKIETQ